MGLDLGTVTIGVAISDAFGWTAQGIETIKINQENSNFGLKRIKELLTEYEVSKIVVGYPLNMNGTIGERAEISEQFAELLFAEFNIPSVLWDERLTTMAAERFLVEVANVRRAKRKTVIDKTAAILILQSYLDSVR